MRGNGSLSFTRAVVLVVQAIRAQVPVSQGSPIIPNGKAAVEFVARNQLPYPILIKARIRARPPRPRARRFGAAIATARPLEVLRRTHAIWQAAFGGGGRGQRLCQSDADLESQFDQCAQVRPVGRPARAS